jgi:hypothetical protein
MNKMDEDPGYYTVSPLSLLHIFRGTGRMKNGKQTDKTGGC